jgi:hypothetical protein
MNNGVLQFSLGLTAGGFLGVVERAKNSVGGLSSKLLSLPGLGTAIGGTIASVSSLDAVVEGVFNAIERGAALEHLSKRTDTSVASLFELQKGFSAVGADADQVGPMIFRMQKALGGVNEYGEDTRSIFARMGLSIEQLKGLNATQQFLQIAGAVNKLNSSSAASAAGAIFGRDGAQTFMQLARSSDDFSAALQRAAHDAQLFERNAAAFAQLERGLNQIKHKTDTLFAGMAEGAAPAIQAIVDQLNSIDLSGVGQQIGKIFTAFTEAFREGKVSDLLALSITTGFQMALAAAPVMFEKLGYFLLKVFETPLQYIQAGMTWVVENAMEGFGKLEGIFHNLVNVLAAGIEWGLQKLIQGLAKIPKLNKALGIEGFTADSFDQILADKNKANPEGEHFKADSWQQILGDEKKNGVKFNVGAGEFGLDDVNSDIQSRWAEMKKNLKNISAPLEAMIDGLVARAPKVKGASTGLNRNGIGDNLVTTKNQYKPEYTNFEKMGFVMGGSSSPMKRTEDLLSQVVRNTASLRTNTPTPPTPPTNQI